MKKLFNTLVSKFSTQFSYSDVTELRRLRPQLCSDLVFHHFVFVNILAGQMFL